VGFGFTCAGDALWRKSQLDNVFALRAFNPHLADKVLLNVEEALLANRAFGLFVHATPPLINFHFHAISLVFAVFQFN